MNSSNGIRSHLCRPFPERNPASNGDIHPLSAADVYYGPDREVKERHPQKARTHSLAHNFQRERLTAWHGLDRRLSHEEPHKAQLQLQLGIEKTLQVLLEREDIDQDGKITIDDAGPKSIWLPGISPEGYRKYEIKGNYMISNLLQELTLAKGYGRETVLVDVDRIKQNPCERLSRAIREIFWKNLTRRIDAENIEKVALDPKNWTKDPRPRIYVPHGAPDQYEYYSRLAQEKPEIRLDVQYLPEEKITGEYVRDLNAKPGLLAIAMEESYDRSTGKKTLRGLPFVVPGGRFNELYGWDSYMESIGLILDGYLDLARSMVTHFCFCIRHYGKIFNANRSCYLGRSQPPFLTDMALNVFRETQLHEGCEDLDFLREAMYAAIKEYNGVWMADPRYDPKSGLSRYRPVGKGVPPETEPSHFTHILEPYVHKHKMCHPEFVEAYNSGAIEEPELDEYFLHDRAVRESGHDTSYRLENIAADLATVDLNSCLYKYETDISDTIDRYFVGSLTIPADYCCEGMVPGQIESGTVWRERAEKRREAMNRYLWNDKENIFVDYHTVQETQMPYESVTTFWTMWSGVASEDQAARLVKHSLGKFEEAGGLASGTEESRGRIGLDRPNRQWDYPFGWAPQQMLAWKGLIRYGYERDAIRLAYKWAFMVAKAFYNFNGVVVEKYNGTNAREPHKVDAEYGNQGADFRGVAKEGFGWVNASYVLAMSLLDEHHRRAIGAMSDWETFEKVIVDPKRRYPPFAKPADEVPEVANNIGKLALDDFESLDGAISE